MSLVISPPSVVVVFPPGAKRRQFASISPFVDASGSLHGFYRSFAVAAYLCVTNTRECAVSRFLCKPLKPFSAWTMKLWLRHMRVTASETRFTLTPMVTACICDYWNSIVDAGSMAKFPTTKAPVQWNPTTTKSLQRTPPSVKVCIPLCVTQS